MPARPAPPQLLLLSLLAMATSAWGQLSTYPGRTYFLALEELDSGDFSRAERAMRSELRTAVQTIDSRWLDSVCFAAGLGEALYQQGRYPEALEQFDGALDLFMNQATWLRRVQWQQTPREDTSIPRRLPAWASANRSAVYADMPRSFLFQYGQVDNSAVAQQGGVVQVAQFWKLDAEEVSRAIAWSLYRRGDLLGPLGAYDARNQAVATRLAGGGLGPGGHWSSAWTELWWGLAEGAAGDGVESLQHLQQAVSLGGRMEHRLGGLALVAQGRLMSVGGDAAAAAALLQRAIAVSAAYDDFLVLTEATRALHELSLADPKAPAPPLGPIADSAERSGLWRVSIEARLALAERAIFTGQAPAARESLATMFRRAREATRGPLGREAERLSALATPARSVTEAYNEAQRAVTSQQALSRRLFQVQLANRWFDDGRLSKRLARQAYAVLLGDPGAVAWQTAPLDCVASLGSAEADAFDRWFAAALERRDPALALQVIDQQRRREVFAAQPLGSRPLAVRWLLEAPDDKLSAAALAARAAVEAAAPEYRELRRTGALATGELREAIAAEPGKASPALRKAADTLADSIAARERLVLRTALSRTPTPMAFPPAIDLVAAKGALVEGEAILVFHVTGGELHGVVLTAKGEHLWRIGKVDDVAADVERLLREVAGTSPKQTWSREQLAAETWREAAAALSERLLKESRLDPATLKRLRVVPAGPLWRAPLALLSLPGAPEGTTLASIDLSLAPTPGWATRTRPEKATTPDAQVITWSVAADAKSLVEIDGVDPLATLADAVGPPQGLAPSAPLVKAAADQLVVDAGATPLAADPLGLPLTSAGRGGREVGAWSGLPYAPQGVIALRNLGGYEAGGGKVRRPRSATFAGDPELHATTSLLAGGAESLLVERWSTGGMRSRALVAEWLSGSRKLDPAAAWRRSLNLGLPEPLAAAKEPRYVADDEAPPSAEHPFWWAGFFLVD